MADEEIPFVPAGDKKPSFFEAFRADLDRLVAEQVGIPHSMFHSGGVVGRRNDKIPFVLDREHKIPLTDPRIVRENKSVVRPEMVITVTHEIDSPPNPAKMTDSRAAEYVERFGDESWELDALPPRVIHDLIETSVKQIRDPELWDQMLAKEAGHMRMLDNIIRTLKGDLTDDDE